MYFLIDHFYNASTSSAATSLFNHASNDALDLVTDVLEGRGRASARAARALLEHTVGLHDVTAPGDVADRYESEFYLFAQQLAQREPGVDLTSGERQRKLQQKYRTMDRKSLGQARLAREQHKSLNRGWATGKIVDRCNKYGLVENYKGYKILSAFVHGNAGGLLGAKRVVGGANVHRTGPSLELCSLAWIEGLRNFAAGLPALPLVSDVDVGPTLSAVDGLLSAWGDVDGALRHVDGLMWPTSPPDHNIIVLGFFPARERWYYLDMGSRMIAHIDPPPNAEEEIAKLYEQWGAEIEEGKLGQTDGRPYTVPLRHLRPSPVPSRRWFPAGSILSPLSAGGVIW